MNTEKRETMEFILNTDLNKSLSMEIDFNFEALKGDLSENLKKYNELVVTEDSIKDAKDDKAQLNKLRTAIEDKRKEVKKACLTPYEKFEVKIKQIVGMIDEPIQAIDKQVKVFAQIEVEKKKELIDTFYSENIGELSELLPLTKFYDSRWENVSMKIKEVQKVILDTITKVRSELEVISSLGSEYEPQIKDKYLQGLNLTVALAEKSRLEEQARKLKEYEEIQAQRKAEQERIDNERKAEQAKVVQAEPVIQPQSVTQLETVAEVETMAQVEAILKVEEPLFEGTLVNTEEPITSMDIRIWATADEIKSVEEFLIACNISFEKLNG